MADNMQQINTRIMHKHDAWENWQEVATTFTPEPGELIIYDTVKDSEGNALPAPKIKIGNGETSVGNLPFILASDLDAINNAISGLESTITNNVLTDIQAQVAAIEAKVDNSITVLSGDAAPAANQGDEGDLYLQLGD